MTLASVFDDRGRIVPVEFIGVHSEKPTFDRMCMNGLLFGMPKPQPWTWLAGGRASVEWFSAWAGERCVAVWEHPVTIVDGYLTVAFAEGNAYEWEALGLPR